MGAVAAVASPRLEETVGGSHAPRVRRVSILGSTGSIGKSAADVISRNHAHFAVEAVTAMDNAELLAEQAKTLGARFAAIGNPKQYDALKSALSGTGIEAACGAEALVEAAMRPADIILAAIVGAAGLKPVLAALERGTDVALANKECLVAAGDVMIRAAAKSGAKLIPVDSEHSGIFQALHAREPGFVERVTITASGGPFRGWDHARMRSVTPAQAVAHPTWSMGAKISVDSATMMNKGLELIEAYHLFPLELSQLGIVVHPESIVHALVSYIDGSTLAQMGMPDMRTPILHALAWPQRLPAGVKRLALETLGSLTFEPWDEAAFPAPRLAMDAARAGGSAPAALNAANEVAVDAFLKGRIGFLDIVQTCERTLERLDNHPILRVEDVMACDAEARAAAQTCIRAIA